MPKNKSEESGKLKKKKTKTPDIIKTDEDETEVSEGFTVSKINWKHMISTGSTLLDLAISGKRKKWGGLPTGILVELAGSSGSGKCVSRNNFITSFDGVFSVDEFFEYAGFPAYKVCKTVHLEHDLFLTNQFGDKEAVKALTFNGKRHIKKIVTKNGVAQEVTMNHPLKVMTQSGNIVWKQAENIEVGEFLLFKRGFLRESTEQEIFDLSQKAYIAGMLVADGWLGYKSSSFTNNEMFLIKKYENFLLSEGIRFRTSDRIIDGRYSSTTVALTSKSGTHKLYNILKLRPGKSKDKFVPLIYRTSGKNLAARFLRGFIDCEGYFTHCSLEVCSASKLLLEHVQQMLIGLGILSSINSKVANNYPENKYWRLHISGANFIQYIETVGSSLLNRKKQFAGYDTERGGYDTSEIIPFQKNNYVDFVSDVFKGGRSRKESDIVRRLGDNLTKQKVFQFRKYITENNIVLEGTAKELFAGWLMLLDGGYFFSEVISNEILPEKDWTYDVSMEKTASFLLNGCVSHNTAVLTEIAARAQNHGGDVFFCDPEARLDKEYAEITGLNIRDMGHYEQPDTVTEFFQHYNDWETDSDVPNVFAGDSLAALSTKMEMEEGDKMGMRRAKEFSECLRKACRTFAKKNVLMVCSNQIRDGGPNGTKTIPGGNAVPFYSSVRMQISPGYPKGKITKEKTIRGAKQKKVIGIQSNVKITKNSLDDPFREVPIFIIFGYGIDDIRGNLTWYKEANNSKSFLLPDGKEVASIDKAIEYVEANGLEKKLRNCVRKLWNEIEESFTTTRKKKEF